MTPNSKPVFFGPAAALLAGLWFGSVWLGGCPAAGAAELRLGDEPYSYTVIDQDLRATLQEFGANTGVRVTVSDAVKGRVRGRLPPLAPRAFLDRLASLYGFEWYYDGYTLHVTAQGEGESKVVSTPGVPFDALKAALDALGVSDSRFVVRPQGADGLVLVAGPPRYVALVEQTAAPLIAQAAAAKPPSATPAPAAPVPVQATAPASLMIYRGAESRRVVFDAP